MTRVIHAAVLFICFLPVQVFSATSLAGQSGEIIKGIKAEGACAIVAMSAEQATLTALQRARAMAIEQAAGVQVSSSTLVKDFALAADFIRTYSRGYIVREEVTWLPIGQYQKDSSSAPIPEYRVKIKADVYVPQKKIIPLGLSARLNSSVFRGGDKAQLYIKAERKAQIAIFNITANDEVLMIFPNEMEKNNIVAGNETIVFPSEKSGFDFVVHSIEGHEKDVESVFIVAMDAGYQRNFVNIFPSFKTISFNSFFKKLSEISDYCEDTILTYEVVNNKQIQ